MEAKMTKCLDLHRHENGIYLSVGFLRTNLVMMKRPRSADLRCISFRALLVGHVMSSSLKASLRP